MRRERWSILGDILSAVAEGDRGGRPARVTAIAQRANLPHDRLVPYLQELHASGLITSAQAPLVTAAGHEFLRTYRAWLEVLARFGLDAPTASEGAADTRALDRLLQNAGTRTPTR